MHWNYNKLYMIRYSQIYSNEYVTALQRRLSNNFNYIYFIKRYKGVRVRPHMPKIVTA